MQERFGSWNSELCIMSLDKTFYFKFFPSSQYPCISLEEEKPLSQEEFRTSPKPSAQKANLPCGTKFLREFNFADWRFFLFCENYFLRLEKTGFSCWELIFVIFWKLRSNRTDNIFVFCLSTCKRKTDKQHVSKVQSMDNNLRVPLDELSTELSSMVFSPSNQYFCM